MRRMVMDAFAVLAATSLSICAYAGDKGGVAPAVASAHAGMGGAYIGSSGFAHTSGLYADERRLGQDRAAARRRAQANAPRKVTGAPVVAPAPQAVAVHFTEAGGARSKKVAPQ